MNRRLDYQPLSGYGKLWKIAGTVNGLLYNLNASEQILKFKQHFQISEISRI